MPDREDWEEPHWTDNPRLDGTKNSGTPDLTDAEHGEQVRVRLAAATPGPWCVVNDQDDWEEISVIQGAVNRSRLPGVYTPICTVEQDDDTADADLIANAPTDLARLLARAEAAEAKVRSIALDYLTLDGQAFELQKRAEAAEAKVARVEAWGKAQARPFPDGTPDLAGEDLWVYLRTSLADPEVQP